MQMNSISNKIIGDNDARRAFNKAGLRATNQRALILEIIRKGKGHLVIMGVVAGMLVMVVSLFLLP